MTEFEIEQRVVAMGMDAFRLALGLPTRCYSGEEIRRWLSQVEQACQANDVSATKERPR